MQNHNECDEHVGNFRHYDTDIGGLEKQFHLGIKICEEEGEEGLILVAYVSVHHEKMMPKPESLRYGLIRSTMYTLQSDFDFLENEFRPRLKRDLELILNGGRPKTLEEIEMV